MENQIITLKLKRKEREFYLSHAGIYPRKYTLRSSENFHWFVVRDVVLYILVTKNSYIDRLALYIKFIGEALLSYARADQPFGQSNLLYEMKKEHKP